MKKLSLCGSSTSTNNNDCLLIHNEVSTKHPLYEVAPVTHLTQ